MTTTEGTKEARRPVETLKFGRTQASIWKNEGKDGLYYTVTFERRYKDAQGGWRGSHAFSLTDLLTLAKACDRAHDAVASLVRQVKPAKAKE